MKLWAAMIAIVRKDLRTELRTKEVFGNTAVFALLAIIVFSFAFELRVPAMRMVAPGIVWVAIAFSGTLGLNRAFAIEQDRGSLTGLLLAPIDRAAIYLGKMLGSFILLLAVAAILLPLTAVLFDVPLLTAPHLLVLLLGAYGFAVVGTIFAALVANTRAREAMLPILLLPVVLPVLVAGVKLTGALLDGEALGELSGWLRLLVLYDVAFTTLACLTFPFVVEE